MSRENVEATRRANAALYRGDFDGLVEVFAPDAVLEDLQNAPDQPARAEGIEAIRANLTLWAAAFHGLCRHRGVRRDTERSPLRCPWEGQGKASGISIDTHQFDLYEFREGKVVRAILGFRSRSEALEAAGLSE